MSHRSVFAALYQRFRKKIKEKKTKINTLETVSGTKKLSGVKCTLPPQKVWTLYNNKDKTALKVNIEELKNHKK